jgi:hypothetical protein
MKESPLKANATRLALATVIAHTIVVAAHAAAHQILGVQASPAQTVFIVAVIIIAPPLAGILIWKNVKGAGAVLLACSMAGAFVFGVYNHFVADSPDHVSHVSVMSPASWAIIFQVTAVLLAAAELFAVYAGVLMLKSNYPLSRTNVK